MPYFSYYLQPLNPPITCVDICLREGYSLPNLRHAALEIQAVLPEAEVSMVDSHSLHTSGPGQLIVWPVGNVDWPGKLPTHVRAALAAGAVLGLFDPQWRRFVLVKPDGYRAWIWRMWHQRLYIYGFMLMSPRGLVRVVQKALTRGLVRVARKVLPRVRRRFV